MTDAITAGLITAWGAIAAAAIAGMVIFFQIKEQSRQSLKNARDIEASKLKLQIYKEALIDSDNATMSQARVHSYLQGFVAALVVARLLDKPGCTAPVPSQRFSELNQLNTDMMLSASRFIRIIENWEIVDCRLYIFKDAVNAAKFDIAGCFDRYVDVAMGLFPIDREGEAAIWHVPSEQQLKVLREVTDELAAAIFVLMNYLMDFDREFQNLLLADIFPGFVSKRQPLDPTLMVITLQDHAELQSRIARDTPWGRERAASEKRVREALAPKQGAV